MISIPDLQTIRFNNVASYGSVYVGVAGSDPLSSPVSVYSDYAGLSSIATPLTLDANGFPVDPTTGTVYNAIYVDFNYSIQILDSYGVELYTPFISSDV